MYTLTNEHDFKLEWFQQKPPFSSFLPGIAGVRGIPMWVFYVNRGQGIASFGVKDKDHAMTEFFPADKAYQYTGTHGFRTLLKLHRNGTSTFMEPFATSHSEETMTISENRLALTWNDPSEGLSVNVSYVSLPDSPLAGLIRHVTIKNEGKETVGVEGVDGLPAIFPSGVPNQAYKELGNTLKSWFDVVNREAGVPFYKLRGSMEDTAEVREIVEGNFYMGRLYYRGEDRVVSPIVDRDVLFGGETSLNAPVLFQQEPLETIQKKTEYTTNKVSGGFTPFDVDLEAGEEIELYSVIGHGSSVDVVNTFASALSVEKLRDLQNRAVHITGDLTANVKTESSSSLFDAYTRQAFLDNGLRGGFPKVFEGENGHKVYYVYSRKHGDLERDYNFFSLSPTYYSQGNGNYRDVNQNRRCDVFFEPKVEDYNVRLFMNLIQLDGYNPLSVKGVRFQLDNLEEVDFSAWVNVGDLEAVKGMFASSFTPGEIIHALEKEDIALKTDAESFLTEVITLSSEQFEAAFGEGFWMDHWTYNLDLIDAYLAVYPDREQTFFFERPYRFFESAVRVKSRAEKYVVKNGDVRQYKAIEHDEKKAAKQKELGGTPWIRTGQGDGQIYETNLYSKLLLLAAVKTTTLAPYGMGVEMEGDKPGWNDSLNGLPGMLGASTSELYELKRLLNQLSAVSGEKSVRLPAEIEPFFTNVGRLLSAVKDESDTAEMMAHWHHVSSLRENYRETIYRGIRGEDMELTTEETEELLALLHKEVDRGIRAVEQLADPLPPTYIYFEPRQKIEGDNVDVAGLTLIPKPVAPFLEGVVKKMKLTDSREDAAQLYQNVRQSPIFDEKLKMYKTSMSIAEEPIELGRAKSFTPGWLENESVFLHMEYKYLLATLQAGLYDDFFADMKTALVPFLDPAVYGRSPLENSSFIASSANPNPALHGRGFVSRLSGSTIEHLNMWVTMMAGKKPFRLEEGTLVCELEPVLPGWMFTEAGELSFTFLGSTGVTYHNEMKADTFGEKGVKPVQFEVEWNHGDQETVESGRLTGRLAEALREGRLKQINVQLG
ncbi:hypothetical protein JSY36_03660 [Bacillus sp. H-16]|uniref:hypothetical protein n=1 Tax=Alteribacter salitolerans TaxID=2912333 RepID=UPI001963A11D|nr:hypothetical protein [Alteribacter salitolerans]MBM7094844.1 hypothetical protein [Alteribacter salitolerans]